MGLDDRTLVIDMQTNNNSPPTMQGLIRTLVYLCLVSSLAGLAVAGEAPAGPISGWRGDGSGCFPEATPPIDWDGETGKYILWKIKSVFENSGEPPREGSRPTKVGRKTRRL